MSRSKILFILLSIILCLFFILDLMSGTVRIPLSDLIQILFGENSSSQEWLVIVREFRIPKTLTALFAGMALSVSGLQMQTVFRNPLAGPYVLGISAGASLGVALLVMGFSHFFASGYVSYIGNVSIAIAAWVGAATVLAVVLSVSDRVRDIMTLLILGMLFSGVVSAVVNILQYFSNESMLKSFVVWTMGSLSGMSGNDLWLFIPAIIFGLILSVFSSKRLNMLLLGENYARSMGLNIKQTRWIIFISTSILAGTVTAFCGPIGFIGVAIPHLCRALFKTSNHLTLNFASMLLGAIILLAADMISQIPGTNIRLPIDAVSALIGIPVIIWIVFKNYKFSAE